MLTALLTVTYGSAGFSSWRTYGYIAFTNSRILFVKAGPFLQEGVVDRDIPSSDVTNIRRSDKPGAAGGPDLVVTAGADHYIQLTSKVSLDGNIVVMVTSMTIKRRGRPVAPTATDHLLLHLAAGGLAWPPGVRRRRPGWSGPAGRRYRGRPG